ncbi:hypothetical protein KC346_g19677, partial [Hortaea werneckii]
MWRGVYAASCALLLTLPGLASAGRQTHQFYTTNDDLLPQQNPFGLYDKRPDDCPPCFNCNLDDFTCQQFANCTKSSGKCSCPPGFGGDDCSEPLCGSLADGSNRLPRQGKECECNEGWEGINCN